MKKLTYIGRGLYSVLTEEQLTELRKSINTVYRGHSKPFRKTQWELMALNPDRAEAFVNRVKKSKEK